MAFHRVPQRLARQDTVVVLAPDFLSFDEAIAFQVVQDLLNRTFRNPDASGNLAQNQRGIRMQQDQHVRVVRQECPPVPTALVAHVRNLNGSRGDRQGGRLIAAEPAAGRVSGFGLLLCHQ